jgi:subtilisin family serine protease
MKKSTILRFFFFGAVLFVTMLLLRPSFAQPAKPDSGVAPAKPVHVNAPDDRPPSMKENVQVMVELSDVPAAVPYAEAMKAARAQAETERNAALANPNSPASRATLKNPKKVEISAADNARVESHAQRLDHIQQGLLPSLTGGNVKAKVLFRTQHAYNGIAIMVNPKNLTAISQLPGVKAIHPMHPKYPSATFSDIDFLRARTTSGPTGPWNSAVLGDNIKVADIDSGLDYVHANFGGNGDYAGVTDTDANGHFPSAKVPGGTDFVGDDYNADDPAHSTPHPDNNPFDGSPTGSTAGHGTATASLIAGLGENNDGTTYTGTYDATSPSIASLKISPGLAPHALLYPLRVFGSSGSTNVVTEAINYAVQNHLDVINMSLGSNEGYADDPDAVAAANAAAAGIIVCSAAGNAGDTYYIHSSPASAAGTLSVAASFNNQAGFIADSNVTGNAPPGLAGQKFPSIYGSPSPRVPNGGKTGDVVYAVPNNAATDGAAGGTTPLSNAAQISGKICLIDRGTSSFIDKCSKAQAAGAIAVIVDNFNNPAADPITMALSSAITIPCVMITRTARDTINTAAGGFNATTGVPVNTVNVTINNDNEVISEPANAVPDTMPSYSSRGPRLPDSAVKPDVTAPAEVVGVATNRSGSGVQNFNGTSSATPHVSGTMALLRQLHPTWTVQELNALLCNTATHNLTATTAGGGSGVGRVGAGRIDLANANNANVVAFNGSDLDSDSHPNQMGVSFGVVETPVNGTRSLTRNITVENKGTTNVTYNLSVVNRPGLAGATYSFPNGTQVIVNAGTTATVPVQLDITGSALKHTKEAGVSFQLPAVVGRQWLTEAAGYAVFTPTDSSPILRVAVYAAPKPVSAMHASTTNFNIKKNAVASVSLPLAGTGVNTGSNYGFGGDILSLVKPFELQFARTGSFNNANLLKYVGVTSDVTPNGANRNSAVFTFGIEGFGDAAVPEFNSSDKEIVIDSDGDGTFDFQVFLTSIPNGTAHSNEYVPVVVDLHRGTATQVPFPYETNLLDPVFNPDGSVGGKDTNAFNNSAVLVPVPANMLLAATAKPGNPAPTAINYVVVTFDRNGNEVDETPLMHYDAVRPGFNVQGGHTEPFYYNDLPGTTIPVQYNSKNFGTNGSLGVLLLHRHNADGQRSDVVTFTQQ